MPANLCPPDHIAKAKPVGNSPKLSKSKAEPSTKIVDNQPVRDYFHFLRRWKNEHYEAGLRTIPLRSCLIHDNSAVLMPGLRPGLNVKTGPKWVTNLYRERVNIETGEVLLAEVYDTNEIKSSNAGKIKRLDTFCRHFQPLYESKQISLLFYTLTQANMAKTDISGVMAALKKRFARRGIGFYGYVWTAEVSENLHFHYHFCVAIDRLHLEGKRLPQWLKVYDVWGRRTQVAFVKKNVRRYMAKYFAKHNARVIGIRSYGGHIFKPKNSINTPELSK